jgi:hypothetical protein
MKIEVKYSVELDDKNLIEKVLKNAEELGYDYSDAGKVETLKRYLTEEGISNVFPESEFDRNLIIVKG